MNSSCFNLYLWWRVLVVLVFICGVVVQSLGLNTDGVLCFLSSTQFLVTLLAFLEAGTTMMKIHARGMESHASPGEGNNDSRVIGLALPNSQLLGSIPADLGMIEFLQYLDLSNNSLNGSLSFSLFNASQLRNLDLSNNLISGHLPETMGSLHNLQLLNLSDNALAGKLPVSLTTLQSLTIVSLKIITFQMVFLANSTLFKF